jgi:hypothetical protein
MLSNFVTASQVFSFKNMLKNIVTTHLDLVFMFLMISYFTFLLDLKKLLFFWLKISRLDSDKNLMT